MKSSPKESTERHTNDENNVHEQQPGGGTGVKFQAAVEMRKTC